MLFVVYNWLIVSADIDNEGVIEGDTEAAQEMGDDSKEVSHST